jgi:hypothetical protein
MRKFLERWDEELLLLAGCGCILYGLSIWSPVITWIIAGIMLGCFAVLIGKMRVKP